MLNKSVGIKILNEKYLTLLLPYADYDIPVASYISARACVSDREK